MRIILITIFCLYFVNSGVCQSVLDGVYIKCIKCDSLENNLKGEWCYEERGSSKMVNKFPIRISFKQLDSNSKKYFMQYYWWFCSIDTSAICYDSTLRNWNGYVITNIYKKNSSDVRGHIPFYSINKDTLWIGKHGEAFYIKQMHHMNGNDWKK
ncbi:MAG TPA: hypothetical protein VNZ45_13910 [Bacteroidia bacterium]|jgi:hypothetical protein|nr:hypothetical protein [Bacteroidia bacterium]